MQPLELGLQNIYVHLGVDIGRVASLDNSRPEAILGDPSFFVRPAHMDRMYVEAACEGIVGVVVVGHR